MHIRCFYNICAFLHLITHCKVILFLDNMYLCVVIPSSYISDCFDRISMMLTAIARNHLCNFTPFIWIVTVATFFCLCCYCNPRKAFLYREGLEAKFNSVRVLLSPRLKQNHLYCKFVVGEHDLQVNMLELSSLIVCRILFVMSWTFWCIHQIQGDWRWTQQNSGNEKFFKDVLPQESIANLTFESGMKLYICVSFQNKVYHMSFVCKLINESSVSGWLVTFVGKENTNATIFCDSKIMGWIILLLHVDDRWPLYFGLCQSLPLVDVKSHQDLWYTWRNFLY